MIERLSYIDSIKGGAIISVLLLHSLSEGALDAIYSTVHIEQAVPVFLTVTCFLSYMAMDRIGVNIGQWYDVKRIHRMIKRVVLPFVIVLLVQCIILLFTNSFDLISIMAGGGYGPGSYYVWVYLQLWIVVPLTYWLLKKNFHIGTILILLVCVFLNVTFSIYCNHDWLWRLSAVRYLFLSVIAWIWYHWSDYSTREKTVFVLLGIISLIYLLFYAYKDWSPIVYSRSWCSQNYPCFFWTLSLILFLVFVVKLTPQGILKPINWLGKNSWEIFLSQMFIIGFVRSLPQIVNSAITAVAYIFFVFFTSIGTAWIYRVFVDKISETNK